MWTPEQMNARIHFGQLLMSMIRTSNLDLSKTSLEFSKMELSSTFQETWVKAKI